MKKSYIFFIIALILIGIGIGVYFYNRNNNNSQSNTYNSERLSATENSTQNENTDSTNQEANSTDQNTDSANQNTNSTDQNTNSANQDTNSTDQNTTSANQNANSTNESSPSNSENTTQEPKTETETQIADFTTKIYTKEKDRQNNVSITCSTLNNTFVNPGETFSFCRTVGKATTAKGYEKADVLKDGEKIQALGGGNCQVSTTLYNAVLKVPGLNVTERHEHSNTVPYIAKGKDAAVSYGTYDLKFVNNTGNKIKISASCDKNYVYCKIFKIE